MLIMFFSPFPVILLQAVPDEQKSSFAHGLIISIWSCVNTALSSTNFSLSVA